MSVFSSSFPVSLVLCGKDTNLFYTKPNPIWRLSLSLKTVAAKKYYFLLFVSWLYNTCFNTFSFGENECPKEFSERGIY